MKKYLFLFLFIPLYFYAFIRYHIGSEIPYKEWLFILNKAIAWTAITCIGLSILKDKSLRFIHTNRRTTGMTGFCLALVHAILVLFLFNKLHFDKLYSGDQLNFQGLMAISIGITSILIFCVPFFAALRKYPNSHKAFRLGKIGFILVLSHPLVIGISGWFHPKSWPFYMPPITLLAILIGVALLIIRSFSIEK